MAYIYTTHIIVHIKQHTVRGFDGGALWSFDTAWKAKGRNKTPIRQNIMIRININDCAPSGLISKRPIVFFWSHKNQKIEPNPKFVFVIMLILICVQCIATRKYSSNEHFIIELYVHHLMVPKRTMDEHYWLLHTQNQLCSWGTQSNALCTEKWFRL